MGQNLRFKAPIRAGDTVHATVTVKELIPEKCRARLTTVCTCRRRDRDRRGCIGNDHVARSPKNLSLRADREGALVGPSAGDLIAKRRLRSKWAPTPRILV
jgi:hypothetical protein